MCIIESTVSIFRCVVFNNRGIAGEDLLVRMTSKINISDLQVVYKDHLCLFVRLDLNERNSQHMLKMQRSYATHWVD